MSHILKLVKFFQEVHVIFVNLCVLEFFAKAKIVFYVVCLN